jgi:hypothetical protein
MVRPFFVRAWKPLTIKILKIMIEEKTISMLKDQMTKKM